MSELEERLNAVLSDPEQLQRLTQMASQLMGGLSPVETDPDGGGSAPASGPETAPAGGSVPAVPNLLGGGLPAMLSQVMQNLKPGKPSPLLDAVSPYLNEARRAKLERSLHIASAARLAGSAFKGMGGANGL